MILSLHHIGIGVSDMDRSIAFYRDVLVFNKFLFDIISNDSMLNRVIGRSVKTRIVMLKKEFGAGAVKLVQLLPLYDGRVGHQAGPIATNRRWGDAGHLEIAVEVSNVERSYADLKKRSVEILMSPQHWYIPDVLDGTFFYVKDPDGAFVEFIQGPSNKEFEDYDGVYAINHAAIGVTDMDRSIEFYTNIFGLKPRIDVRGTFPGEEVIVGDRIDERIVMLNHPNGGARIELVSILAPNHSKPNPPEKRWGDIGVMEVAFEVDDLAKVCHEISEKDILFLCPISNIPETDIKYVFIADPDDSEIGLYEFPKVD